MPKSVVVIIISYNLCLHGKVFALWDGARRLSHPYRLAMGFQEKGYNNYCYCITNQ